MSCECVSCPSERTSAHRSPMVCSRRGSASNTAGNWPIHCLAVKQEGEHVYYTQDDKLCHTPALLVLYSPDQVADLCPPQASFVRGTILISERKSQGSKQICKMTVSCFLI